MLVFADISCVGFILLVRYSSLYRKDARTQTVLVFLDLAAVALYLSEFFFGWLRLL